MTPALYWTLAYFTSTTVIGTLVGIWAATNKLNTLRSMSPVTQSFTSTVLWSALWGWIGVPLFVIALIMSRFYRTRVLLMRFIRVIAEVKHSPQRTTIPVKIPTAPLGSSDATAATTSNATSVPNVPSVPTTPSAEETENKQAQEAAVVILKHLLQSTNLPDATKKAFVDNASAVDIGDPQSVAQFRENMCKVIAGNKTS